MRWLFSATATVVLCFLYPAWGGSQSRLTDRTWWYGDLRLNKPVTLQRTNQTIGNIVTTISGETQVPLVAHERVRNWRLTMVVHGKAAYEVLDLIAKMYDLMWYRREEGYLLSGKGLHAWMSEEEHRKLHEQAAQQRDPVKRQETTLQQGKEFSEQLMKASTLTDEEVLALAAPYPAIHQRLERDKTALMTARLITWLTPEQRKQATVSVANGREWGLKIERKDVLLTGPDYGREFTYVYIRIRPDGGRLQPVAGQENLGRILWNIECDFHFYRPDGSKLSYGAYF